MCSTRQGEGDLSSAMDRRYPGNPLLNNHRGCIQCDRNVSPKMQTRSRIARTPGPREEHRSKRDRLHPAGGRSRSPKGTGREGRWRVVVEPDVISGTKKSNSHFAGTAGLQNLQEVVIEVKRLVPRKIYRWKSCLMIYFFLSFFW